MKIKPDIRAFCFLSFCLLLGFCGLTWLSTWFVGLLATQIVEPVTTQIRSEEVLLRECDDFAKRLQEYYSAYQEYPKHIGELGYSDNRYQVDGVWITIDYDISFSVDRKWAVVRMSTLVHKYCYYTDERKWYKPESS